MELLHTHETSSLQHAPPIQVTTAVERTQHFFCLLLVVSLNYAGSIFCLDLEHQIFFRHSFSLLLILLYLTCDWLHEWLLGDRLGSNHRVLIMIMMMMILLRMMMITWGPLLALVTGDCGAPMSRNRFPTSGPRAGLPPSELILEFLPPSDSPWTRMSRPRQLVSVCLLILSGISSSLIK